jgi:hypothetical protein
MQIKFDTSININSYLLIDIKQRFKKQTSMPAFILNVLSEILMQTQQFWDRDYDL